jgi:hypothetical protein
VQTFDWGEVPSKIIAFVKIFPIACGTPPAHKEIVTIFYFLMVRNQIGNLIFSPFICHNLCFKCSNGSWEPILDIYIPRTFQWYNFFCNLMNFDTYNLPLKICEFIGTLIFRSVGVHPLTLFLNSQQHEMWLSGFTFGPHLCKTLFWSGTQD